jgi:hypothetical protein
MKSKMFFLWLLCFLGNSLLFAQWDKYPTYQEYLALMTKFQADYPQLCKTVEMGTSVQGRKLIAIKISDNVDKEEKEPAFLYHAAMHGDEVLGYVLLLRLIDYLLVNYGKDPLVTKLVDNIEIWIDPLVNPDGTYKAGDATVNGAIRGNANGIDLNRNWPCWCLLESHKFGMYDSFAAEVKALKGLVDSHNFVVSADFHGGSQSIMYPSKHISGVDKPWWLYVCTMYADTANTINPGYLTIRSDDTLGIYETHGSWIYYPFIYRHFRNITLELSMVKLVPPSQLNNFWNHNCRSLLNYVEQAMFGIQGTVTDSLTGQALQAKVYVENNDKDSSIVYSHPPLGDFYRPIYKGAYSVTFSANGYLPKTITNIKVENNAATVLNVKLAIDQTAIVINENRIPAITVANCNGLIRISYTHKLNTRAKVSIFDVSGRLVRKLPMETGTGKQVVIWDGLNANGAAVSKSCYVALVAFGDKTSATAFFPAGDRANTIRRK